MICVQGRQYIWRYIYGAACQSNPFKAGLPYSYQTMYVPQDVTVVLSITSVDVIHSWWVPSLGGKVDAVPGYTTYTWFQARGPALYHGHCAQLCGRQHATMTALVDAMPPSAVPGEDRPAQAGHPQGQLPGDRAARLPDEDGKPLGD